MRTIVAFTLSVLFSVTSLIAAPVRSTGASLTVIGHDATGCTLTFLSAFRSSGTTFLFYDVSDTCQYLPIISGFVEIPNTALEVTKTQGSLTVTIPDGTISVVLLRDGAMTTSFIGQSLRQFSGGMLRTNGSTTEHSAGVNGYAFGHVFSGASGTFSLSREMTVEVTN